MLKGIRDFLFERISKSKRVHALYILPTMDGIKVLSLNMLLLILGLMYANNYVLLFNFILFCLFLASMFYTHFNLSGLKLEALQFTPVHAGEDGLLTLDFSTTNSQSHYFINVFFKNPLLNINLPHQKITIPPNQRNKIDISIRGIKRGSDSISSIYVETLFPLNFFRCFTFFRVDLDVIVFPERSDLKLHDEISLVETSKEEGDDFYIRDFIPGDSLKRVDWKKLAQSNRWYTRQYQCAKPAPVLLILDKTPVEETLKSICFTIHTLHQQNIKYGIKLGTKVFISPENSPHHLNQCLGELARYEA